jgi:prepilin-type N-terminal cleavage/methylation domain-containing protein
MRWTVVRWAERGFTLIEVIGALVLFASGLLIAGLLSGGLTIQMRNASLRSEAGALGRQTVDSLAVLPYGDLSAGTAVQHTVTVQGRTFTRRWTVSQEGPRTLRVFVEVEPPIAGAPGFSAVTYLVEDW